MAAVLDDIRHPAPAAASPVPINARPLRKWERVLRALLEGRTFNRFEAVRELRDWCLHTTVASLEARGVRIDRQDESVPGQYGTVHCKRYRLAAESRERALELLGREPPTTSAQVTA